jgi:hypothetical protein
MILIQLGSQNYSAQPRVFETPTLDPVVRVIKITLTRENWPGDPQTPLVTMGFEVSLDGVTYPAISGGSGTANGGVVLERDNVTPLPSQVFTCDVPGIGLATRKVRVTVENFQPLRTAILAEAL